MIKGDKIKLKRAMGIFTNVGEICEVTDVAEGGIISFKFGNGRHLGCMSYDEYLKYFEPVVEPVKPKREWTEWKKYSMTYYNIDGANVLCTIEYRHNEKKVQIKSPNWGLKAEASCHEDDKFDLSTGIKLAIKRLTVKILNQQVKELAEGM